MHLENARSSTGTRTLEIGLCGGGTYQKLFLCPLRRCLLSNGCRDLCIPGVFKCSLVRPVRRSQIVRLCIKSVILGGALPDACLPDLCQKAGNFQDIRAYRHKPDDLKILECFLELQKEQQRDWQESRGCTLVMHRQSQPLIPSTSNTSKWKCNNGIQRVKDGCAFEIQLCIRFNSV